MWHDFFAVSFGTHLVLYDPAAIPNEFPFDPDTETPEPAAPPSEALRHLAVTGNALVLDFPEGDCEASIRVLVDEPLPDHCSTQQTQSLLASRLNIPSGFLTASGAEFIHPTPQARKHADGAVALVPRGSYVLQVVDQIAWKAAHQESYVESKTTSAGRRVAKAVDWFTYTWVMLFVSTILIIPGIVVLVWINLGLVAGLIVIGVVIAVHVAYLAAFGVLEWASVRWPEIDQPSLARSEFQREHPDIFVALSLDSLPAHEAKAAFMVVRAVPQTG